MLSRAYKLTLKTSGIMSCEQVQNRSQQLHDRALVLFRLTCKSKFILYFIFQYFHVELCVINSNYLRAAVLLLLAPKGFTQPGPEHFESLPHSGCDVLTGTM